MIDKLKNNDLIITNNKKEILKTLNSNKMLISLRLMTLQEFKDKYFGTYKKQALYYLIKKYHYKYEVAKMYLDNFYYIKDLKQELEQNNLIEIEPLFKESIKRVVIDNIKIDSYILDELKKYDYIFLEEQQNKYDHKVYEFENIEEEINNVALDIIELLKSVNINKIKIVNVGNEYIIPLKRIFSFYHIPINLKQEKSIFGLKNTQEFVEILKETLDYNKALSVIKDIELYNTILSICNDYQFKEIDETIIYCIEEEIKRKTIISKKIKDAIQIVDIQDICNDDYYFILGFNQGILPKNYKDEDYLNDKTKANLGIMTSLEKNINEKEIVKQKITNYPNIHLSYKLKSSFEEFYKSSLIDDMGLEVIKIEDNNYNYSHLYNELRLAKNLDRLIKYNEYNSNLDMLYHNYQDIPYLKYDNRYKVINKDKLLNYINNKLLLSYSSLDNYYRCGFRYYLSNILKLDKFEETFMTYIGNLFHHVLSKSFLENFDFDDCFNNYIKDKIFTPKESFFIDKLKNDLLFTIETIKKQDEDSLLDQALYEQKIFINKDENVKITFMGIIDKLKYKKENNNTIVAIIDYKTGNPNINLNNAIYGLEMQLPIYLYLAENSKLQNVKIGGFYLQKIVHSKLTYQMNKNNEIELEKLYCLEGYSNSDEEILKYVDKNYNDSQMIKGMKVSSKGFYAYTKVLEQKQIDKLIELVNQKIDEAAKNILKADFSINPKKVGQNLLGCEFCKFKDICYKKEENIINLKEQKYQDFLGGEPHA